MYTTVIGNDYYYYLFLIYNKKYFIFYKFIDEYCINIQYYMH